MKRLIFALLIWPFLLGALKPMGFKSKAATVAGTGYTIAQNIRVPSTSNSTFDQFSSEIYHSAQFTANASYTIAKVELEMSRVGSGTASSMVAEIRSDSTDTPGAVLATSTNTITSADVSGSQGFIAFLFAGQAVTNGTKYWIGVHCTTASGTDYYTYYRASAGANAGTYSSADGTSWSQASGANGWTQKTYTSP